MLTKKSRQKEEKTLDILDYIMKENEYTGITPNTFEIADYVERARSWVNRQVKMLKTCGYLEQIERNSYGGNRKLNLILTDKGQKALDLDTLVWKE